MAHASKGALLNIHYYYYYLLSICLIPLEITTLSQLYLYIQVDMYENRLQDR